MNAPARSAFLEAHGLTSEEFATTSLTWEMLDAIRADHLSRRADFERDLKFVTDTLSRVEGVHSIKSRIKDADHLVAKIIRKASEGRIAVEELDVKTYPQHVTDLVGIRVLHLFKDEWRSIHCGITSALTFHEEPIAYVRAGDDPSLPGEGINLPRREHPFGYRSIHYLVHGPEAKGKRSIVELQVRTIFEEAWSEIDHRFRYPRQSNDQSLTVFLQILNRLAGSADEMGSFVKMLVNTRADQVAEMTKLQEKAESDKKNLQEQISRLQLDAKAKDSLNKNVEKVSSSAVAAASSLYGQSIIERTRALLQLSGNITAAVIPNIKKQCPHCGEQNLFSPFEQHYPIGAAMIIRICTKCGKTL